MAATTSASALVLLVACLCVANVCAGRNLAAVRRTALAGQRMPVGWWYALKPRDGNNTFCGLRDFPPYGGYGASRMYCPFPTYDHYWMWRLIKVNTSVSATIASGNEVYLTIFNPMPYKYCQLRSNVMCGYQNGTKFVVEKAAGSGNINTSSDDIVLKVGTGYCSLVGRGHSQQFTCRASTKDRATVFTLATNSFIQSQLVNGLTNMTCGGYFYQSSMQGMPNTVSCGSPTFPGFTTNLTMALRTPGASNIAAGEPVAFKAYDDFYTYAVATWFQRGGNVTYVPEKTQGDNQWFTMERVGSGAPTGGELANATVVALRSNSTGLYCGLRLANATALTCDREGPLSSLPAGYKYTYILVR